MVDLLVQRVHLWLGNRGALTAVPAWARQAFAAELEANKPIKLRGLTKTSFPEGSGIVVDGYLEKDGTNRANGRDITMADGKNLLAHRHRSPAGR